MEEKKVLKVELCDAKAKLPVYAYADDAGLDLFSPIAFVLKAGERTVVDTKVALELPEGTVALIWDKSGLSIKKGLKVLGGVFDRAYRGTYMIGLINLSKEDIVFEESDKICQLLIQPIVQVSVEQVDEIDVLTSRGEGRMGSSGR